MIIESCEYPGKRVVMDSHVICIEIEDRFYRLTALPGETPIFEEAKTQKEKAREKREEIMKKLASEGTCWYPEIEDMLIEYGEYILNNQQSKSDDCNTAKKIYYSISEGINEFGQVRIECQHCKTSNIRSEAVYCPMCGRKFV